MKKYHQTQGKHREEDRVEKDTRAKGSIHGAKEVDRKEVATFVVETTTQENVHRIRKEEKEKGKTMDILHRGNGRPGIHDSDQASGKIGDQETPKDGEREKERGLTE